jgi:hypothetical protein
VPLLLTGSGARPVLHLDGTWGQLTLCGWRLVGGIDDGVVRLWHDVDDPQRVGQVTAWRALSDILVSNRGAARPGWALRRVAGPDLCSLCGTLGGMGRAGAGSGMVMEWQQRRGTLIVSGDTRIVRVWDVERQLCVQVRVPPRQSLARAMSLGPDPDGPAGAGHTYLVRVVCEHADQ